MSTTRTGKRGSTPPKPAGRGRQLNAGAGLPARRIARDIVWTVLHEQRTLSDELDIERGHALLKNLDERDRALVRMLTSTTFRRYGQILDLIGRIYPKGLPERAGHLRETLYIAIAQLMFMDVPDHAAVDLAMRLVNEDRRAKRFNALANAGLRRIAREGAAMVAAQDAAKLNTPRQLWQGWVAAYGEEKTRAIANAHLNEAALDLTVKQDPHAWAETLRADMLPTGSLRLDHKGRVDTLPGFSEGAWWVQDVAARLPAKLLGDLSGKHVADLCAAPGGKTAQLAAAGAHVTAVELSQHRAERLAANLARLHLKADLVIADALAWQPAAPLDTILLDAPCTATGTLRRHPDAAWTKGATARSTLVDLQARLLRHAAGLLKPGGVLVYCTCSLEPEEGEQQIGRLLQDEPAMRTDPVSAAEFADLPGFVTPEGWLRTLPCMLADRQPAGMDGFFAARLIRL